MTFKHKSIKVELSTKHLDVYANEIFSKLTSFLCNMTLWRVLVSMFNAFQNSFTSISRQGSSSVFTTSMGPTRNWHNHTEIIWTNQCLFQVRLGYQKFGYSADIHVQNIQVYTIIVRMLIMFDWIKCPIRISTNSLIYPRP